MATKKEASDADKKNYVVTMRLYPEPWQEDILNKRFKIMEQMKNSLIRFELKKLERLKQTLEWREMAAAFKTASDKEKKSLYKKRDGLLREAGFGRFTFIDDITPMQKHFAMHIATHVAHRSAEDVWRAFEKMLFKGSKKVSYIRKGTLESVGTKKSSMNLNTETWNFKWAGGKVIDSDGKERVLSELVIRMQKPETEYEMNAFRDSITTYRVVRRWYGAKFHWCVQITFEGTPPQKSRPVGEGRVGIDIGVRSIAIVSDEKVILRDLSPKVHEAHREKLKIQRKMDRSRRAMNPDNYKLDGTIKRGVKLTHNKSRRYMLLQGQFRELARKEAAVRKQEHIELANEILAMGTEIYIERMEFKALQARSKQTSTDPKTGRIRSKKRFGKSLARGAPAEMVSILNQKLGYIGKNEAVEVDQFSYKASQLDHTNREYKKKTLSERRAILSNGDVLQRDMYSAWLIQNAGADLMTPDWERCDRTYGHFKELQDAEWKEKRKSKNPLSSFGVV